MGACEFWQVGEGKTVREAFRSAVEEAQYEHGHGGYSGTLAEKSSYVVIDSPRASTYEEALALSRKLMDECDKRIDDKWGPAGAIPFEGKWLFFGWASS